MWRFKKPPPSSQRWPARCTLLSKPFWAGLPTSNYLGMRQCTNKSFWASRPADFLSLHAVNFLVLYSLQWKMFWWGRALGLTQLLTGSLGIGYSVAGTLGLLWGTPSMFEPVHQGGCQGKERSLGKSGQALLLSWYITFHNWLRHHGGWKEVPEKSKLLESPGVPELEELLGRRGKIFRNWSPDAGELWAHWLVSLSGDILEQKGEHFLSSRQVSWGTGMTAGEKEDEGREE